MIRLMIVDDDILIRESLKVILGTYEGIEVVGAFENGKECVDSLQKVEIDMILLDMRMPVMDGIEVLKYLKGKGSIVPEGNIHVLVLTTFDEDDLINGALSYGASGYILKNSTPDKIVSAIRAVADGNGVFHQDIIKRMGEVGEIKVPTLKGLSEREMDIVKEIACGLSNKEIAENLYISEGTVKNYITSILTKLNLKHRTQIAVAYLKQSK